MNPAHSARRLFIGTGLGLLLATGLALISGVMSIEPLNASLLIPLAGLLFLVCAMLTGNSEGLLSGMFPDENNEAMVSRVKSDLSENKKEAEVGDAWAKLEETMLSNELEEE